MTSSQETTENRNRKTLETDRMWKRVNGQCAIFGSNESETIECCRFYGTGMVNRATPALDIGRIRGQVEWGGDGGGKDERDCEAIASGEMQNETIEETKQDRVYGIPRRSPAVLFLFRKFFVPGAVYSSEDEVLRASSSVVLDL
jgi:hypothetical protein